MNAPMETKMDKEFWQAIVKNDSIVPPGHSAGEYLDELLQNLGSTDAELRDELSLTILSTWLEGRAYTDDQMRGLLSPLMDNLNQGLGENGTDTVFLRTFSALILAELIHCDNKQPYLTQAEVLDLLEKTLTYLLAEKDPRGYVPGKGWAHALAHTADLLMVLASSRHLNAENLGEILQGIETRLVNSGHTIYTNDEDERLVRVVSTILEQGLLDIAQFAAWSLSLVQMDGNSRWKDAYLDEGHDRARHNIKTFLRSLHYRLIRSGKQKVQAMEFIPILQENLKVLTPWA
jgi:hypothetical protein